MNKEHNYLTQEITSFIANNYQHKMFYGALIFFSLSACLVMLSEIAGPSAIVVKAGAQLVWVRWCELIKLSFAFMALITLVIVAYTIIIAVELFAFKRTQKRDETSKQ